jgi:hypothetical protein
MWQIPKGLMRSYKLLPDGKWGWKKDIHGVKSTSQWKLPGRDILILQ